MSGSTLRRRWTGVAIVALAACACAVLSFAAAPRLPARAAEDLLVLPGEIGRPGGRLVVALRAEPKTLNPLVAADAPSRDVIGVMQADLIHIRRATQLTEPAVAKSWKVSTDGLRYTLELRKGLRFSDGHPLDADDVVFSFHVYLDENVHAPQRDLLIVGGKPILVQKRDTNTVTFELAQPYGAAERLFDGFAILPRHLLEDPYREGKLGQAWLLTTPPDRIAGLGPFRLKDYVPGQKLVLERNPFYWKADSKGNRLPYLQELVFLFVSSAEAQVIRFQSGETDLISRLDAESYAALSRQAHGYVLADAGPGLEYNFLFLNLNDLGDKAAPEIARKQKWFRDARFRQAISSAVDREGIVRLVYQGRGAPLWGPVTPGNPRWVNASLPRPPRSLDRARELLRAAGFSWKNGAEGEPLLFDPQGAPVEFSVLTSSSNVERTKMATLIQDDLKKLGMRVQIVPLEFRSLLDRVFQTKAYEACVLGLANSDADPSPEMNVWLSSGGLHVWNPSQPRAATPWEEEIDRLMKQQLSERTYPQRKRLYDRVQEILWANQPMVFLASPNILVGARDTVGNFQPAVLEPYVLWNVEQLYFRSARESGGR